MTDDSVRVVVIDYPDEKSRKNLDETIEQFAKQFGSMFGEYIRYEFFL